MGNKIGISELIAELALSSGNQKEICEGFLYVFSEIVTEALAKGESVTIDGFGVFKTTMTSSSKVDDDRQNGDSNAFRKIVFVPSKEFAVKLNGAFDAFETVELAEGVELSGLDNLLGDSIDNLKEIKGSSIELKDGDEAELTIYRLDEQSDEEGYDDESTAEAYAALETLEPPETESEKNNPVFKSENGGFPEDVQSKDEDQNEAIDNEIMIEPSSKFSKGFFYGVVCTLLICGTIFLIGFYNGWYGSGWKNDKDKEDKNELAMTNQTFVNSENDSINSLGESEIETETPENKIVYDTVSPTRVLTKIARDHYGNMHLWPYIYEENSSILGHPNRIKPGTRIVVPPLSKYGVDANNPADIEKAKNKALQIYSRYN